MSKKSPKLRRTNTQFTGSIKQIKKEVITLTELNDYRRSRKNDTYMIQNKIFLQQRFRFHHHAKNHIKTDLNEYTNLWKYQLITLRNSFHIRTE